ncbi:MAG: hypothetical protein WBH44_07580 [Proteocatella sp.]
MDRLVRSDFEAFNSKISSFTDTNSKMLSLFANNEVIEQALSSDVSDANINAVISKFDSINGSSKSIALGLCDGRIFTGKRNFLPEKFDPRARQW